MIKQLFHRVPAVHSVQALGIKTRFKCFYSMSFLQRVWW